MDNTERETPQELFKTLNRKFKFTLDVCAIFKNAKCKRYFTKKINGLLKKWRGICWCNPPFDHTKRMWVKKA